MWHNQGHETVTGINEQKKRRLTLRPDCHLLFLQSHTELETRTGGCTPIIQLGGINLKDYLTAIASPGFYQVLDCPSCCAPRSLKRHGKYERYLLVSEQGQLTWLQTPIIRIRCRSCGSTHALLPADVVAYCQYSLPVLIILLSQILLESASVPQVAQQYQCPIWSVYLVLRRYEQCLARIGLVLYELGCQPTDKQCFTSRECLRQISQGDLTAFRFRYWQHNRRYLWQSRYHNRASPPVTMGWHETGIAAFT